MACHLFDSLSLDPILNQASPATRHGQPLSERVFALVANRLTRPGSEHALAQWLTDFYVVTVRGSRWVPQWKVSRRVKVSFEQRRLWYETLDDLLAQKAGIETAIWQELRHLFSLGTRAGVLRHHLDLFRGARAGRVRTVRLQPGR